eukprot:12842073-Heterocapsa_arctica.AAC.1
MQLLNDTRPGEIAPLWVDLSVSPIRAAGPRCLMMGTVSSLASRGMPGVLRLFDKSLLIDFV